MSKLYSTLQSENVGKVTRTANRIVQASVQSWDGSAALSMNKDGIVYLYVGHGSTDHPPNLVMATTISELLDLVKRDKMIKL